MRRVPAGVKQPKPREAPAAAAAAGAASEAIEDLLQPPQHGRRQRGALPEEILGWQPRDSRGRRRRAAKLQLDLRRDLSACYSAVPSGALLETVALALHPGQQLLGLQDPGPTDLALLLKLRPEQRPGQAP